jgi:hypothetical protein
MWFICCSTKKEKKERLDQKKKRKRRKVSDMIMKINNCVGGANKRKILPLPFIIISDKEFHGKKGECNIFNTNIIFQSFKGIDVLIF